MIQVTMPQVGFRKLCNKWERQCDSGKYPQLGFRKLCQKLERQSDSGNHATSGIQETVSGNYFFTNGIDVGIQCCYVT